MRQWLFDGTFETFLNKSGAPRWQPSQVAAEAGFVFHFYPAWAADSGVCESWIAILCWLKGYHQEFCRQVPAIIFTIMAAGSGETCGQIGHAIIKNRKLNCKAVQQKLVHSSLGNVFKTGGEQ